jgi:hypothetical protein
LDEGAVLEIPIIVFYLVPGVTGSSVVLTQVNLQIIMAGLVVSEK